MGDLIALVAVAAPFLMVCAIVWIKSRSNLDEKRLAGGAMQNSEAAAMQAHKIEQLEERVRVLESIVTDRGFNVAGEIEALRGQRAAREASRPHID